jgi:RNA polymerase sigma-70 factor, ECF subfamily
MCSRTPGATCAAAGLNNEGYSGRVDLASEAIRLGRLLAALMPDEPEVHGWLALMQIHHARRKARFSGGELVLLED